MCSVVEDLVVEVEVFKDGSDLLSMVQGATSYVVEVNVPLPVPNGSWRSCSRSTACFPKGASKLHHNPSDDFSVLRGGGRRLCCEERSKAIL